MRERPALLARRLLGWAVSSPAAFALAGVLDLAWYAFSTITARWAPGRGSWRRR